ncbi:uncharacterized protein PHACADRAFT_213996 [Phanerochaete carnosa HHB-10118-sp]|uniref:Uncharacterized protein n=1 Tax=Phanerochaete carnosa (strain HHB-10118-sp) TaxID=650164 RepID=K5VUK5_PHACS|nr:uncharacterized protein PHACADRAFT_213996 [Phanerochaete carnosa HHB-10118-sp]EKM50269.1 hypothetical protein PHACADRAFT_213996 [Phanerochaete carnosa HHB-10118-sp]
MDLNVHTSQSKQPGCQHVNSTLATVPLAEPGPDEELETMQVDDLESEPAVFKGDFFGQYSAQDLPGWGELGAEFDGVAAELDLPGSNSEPEANDSDVPPLTPDVSDGDDSDDDRDLVKWAAASQLMWEPEPASKTLPELPELAMPPSSLHAESLQYNLNNGKVTHSAAGTDVDAGHMHQPSTHSDANIHTVDEAKRQRMENALCTKIYVQKFLSEAAGAPIKPREAFNIYYRNMIECVRALYSEPEFAAHLVFLSEQHYSDADHTLRLFHEVHTGKWWWAAQKAVEANTPGDTIILIILSSDKMQLTLFCNKAAYPVYMTIGNLPKDICSKPSRGSQILLAYLPTTKLEHITNKAA